MFASKGSALRSRQHRLMFGLMWLLAAWCEQFEVPKRPKRTGYGVGHLRLLRAGNIGFGQPSSRYCLKRVLTTAILGVATASAGGFSSSPYRSRRRIVMETYVFRGPTVAHRTCGAWSALVDFLASN